MLNFLHLFLQEKPIVIYKTVQNQKCFNPQNRESIVSRWPSIAQTNNRQSCSFALLPWPTCSSLHEIPFSEFGYVPSLPLAVSAFD